MNLSRILAVVTAVSLLPALTVGTANAQISQCQGLGWQTQPSHPAASNGGSSAGLSQLFAGSSNNSAPSGATGPATVTRQGVVKYTATPDSPTQFLQLLTGPGSPDRTDNKWGVTATDLGFAYESNGQTNLVFGDTFSCEGDGGWRSNVILRTNDVNYGDGLRLQTALTRNGYTTSGTAKEFIPARHAANDDRTEVTTIPTSAIVINGVHYMDYMSVRQWGESGRWTTNYAATMRSTDNGVTWTRVNDSYRRNSSSGVGFPAGVSYKAGNENLQMSAFAEDRNDPNYVYRFSTPSGRYGSAVLGRALKSQFPNESAFEFWNGSAWVKDASQATPVIDGRVSELSIAYSDYLGKYVALYLVEGTGLVMRTADKLNGQWSNQRVLVSQSTVPDIYGGFILPRQDDNNLYYVATTWSGYNVMLMRTNLDHRVVNAEFDDNIDIESVVKVADFPG